MEEVHNKQESENCEVHADEATTEGSFTQPNIMVFQPVEVFQFESKILTYTYIRS